MSRIRRVATAAAPTPVITDDGLLDDNAPIEAHDEEGTAMPTVVTTDARSAEHFAATTGHRVRFDHRQQTWRHWYPPIWRLDDDGAIERLAIDHAHALLDRIKTLPDPDTHKKAALFAVQSESRQKIQAMLGLARSLPPIADRGDQWNRDPWLLACPNGVIDLRSGVLRRGRREDRLTRMATAPFDPQAPCPRFQQVLADMFANDDTLINFVQKAVGYSVTGITSEQILFLCHGTGSNGKGTLMRVLLDLLGDYGYNMPFSTLELHQRSTIPNDIAALVGRRLVVASETNESTRFNEARLKALTGCDRLTGRFLHAEFFEFDPVAKFWLAVNHLPIARDDSYAFWRRIRTIPFTRTFPINKRVPDTLRAEASGMLRWAVDGCLRWQRDGFDPLPPAVRLATDRYRADSDVIGEFLRTACVEDPAGAVRAAEFFAHYQRWAQREGLTDRERLSATAFGRKLAERFPKDRTALGAVYAGVRLVDRVPS